jgi:hypothetical protein
MLDIEREIKPCRADDRHVQKNLIDGESDAADDRVRFRTQHRLKVADGNIIFESLIVKNNTTAHTHFILIKVANHG